MTDLNLIITADLNPIMTTGLNIIGTSLVSHSKHYTTSKLIFGNKHYTTFANRLSRIDQFSLGPIEEGSKRGRDDSRGAGVLARGTRSCT